MERGRLQKARAAIDRKLKRMSLSNGGARDCKVANFCCRKDRSAFGRRRLSSRGGCGIGKMVALFFELVASTKSRMRTQ